MLRWKLIAFVVLVMSLAGAGTAAAAPELSVSDRLQDRRYEIRRVTLDGRRVRYRAGRRTAASRCS